MFKRYWLVAFSFAFVLGWVLFNYFNMPPVHLYKVISVENWEQSKLQNQLVLPSMDNDFIHLATKQQLDGIINKFWKNEPKFFVLTIEAVRLPGKLVLESNPGGSNKYYHLYDGFIPISTVTYTSKVLK